ncbi:leucine zipper domain-containing protein (plasmid) [Streptomyces sp. NBC_01276]
MSRNCFYQWQRRYQEEGLEGLRDHSSAPHHSPNATDADMRKFVAGTSARHRGTVLPAVAPSCAVATVRTRPGGPVQPLDPHLDPQKTGGPAAHATP